MSTFNGLRLHLIRDIYSEIIRKFMSARESSHTKIRSNILEIKLYVMWARGLRHEISSPVQTLGLRFRIPLEAWMSEFILCLCCPV
jgi:hypothetical protein